MNKPALKKPALVANACVWAVVALVCIAFQVWYRTGSVDDTFEVLESSLVMLEGLFLSAPLLMFAIGVLLGIALVQFKHLVVSRITRTAVRAVGVFSLVWFVATAISIMVDTGSFALFMVAATYIITSMAPIIYLICGFAYAIGLADIDTTKKPLVTGPFTPDD